MCWGSEWRATGVNAINVMLPPLGVFARPSLIQNIGKLNVHTYLPFLTFANSFPSRS